MLALFALLLSGCGQEETARFDPLPSDALVLVIGDSLVAGTGAPRGSSWPEQLALKTGWSVVNGGVPGDTSADALTRLVDLLDTHQPQAVIIAVGGNDFLRNLPPAQTRSNLEAMIRESQAQTPHTALVAIPEKSIGAALIGNLSDHALFGELADKHSLAFVPALVSDVLSREELRTDHIHANAKGYAMIAEGVVEALARQGWLVR